MIKTKHIIKSNRNISALVRTLYCEFCTQNSSMNSMSKHIEHNAEQMLIVPIELL